MPSSGQRTKLDRRLHRRSSDESISSATSPSKTHRRRRSSFSGLTSVDLDRDIHMNSFSKKGSHASWNPGNSSSAFSQVPAMDSSPDNKIGRKTLGGDEDKNLCCAFELIRELSFSPIQNQKKRADSADTDMSSTSDSSDARLKGNTSPIGLDLDVNFHQLEDMRRSPSPLIGLKYLPEGNMFI